MTLNLRNNMRTAAYLGLLTGLFLLIGYLVGGGWGTLIAFGVAIVFNGFSYWFSDKIVLATYKAKELTREQAPNIYSIVQDLCYRASIPMPRIYLIPMQVPNAFATGRNEHHAALGITSALLEIMDREELQGVLAHEISHIKNKDVLTGTLAATLAGAISWLGYIIYMFSGRRGRLVAYLIFVIATPFLATLIRMALSRTREFSADQHGARLVGHGNGLASALVKIEEVVRTNPLIGNPAQQATSHLFISNPFAMNAWTRLFSSHPPTEERVKRLTGRV